MSLINQIARIMFIRKKQYDLIDNFTMRDCVFVRGPAWEMEYQNWFNLSDLERTEWLEAAKIWTLALSEKSPLTYSYISNHFRDGLVTKENLDTL